MIDGGWRTQLRPIHSHVNPGFRVQLREQVAGDVHDFLTLGFKKASDVNLAARVRRSVTKSGFHLELGTEIATTHSCAKDFKLALVENIPGGIYFDLDEIRSAASFGGPALVSPSWYIDVERPTEASTQHVVGFESRSSALLCGSSVVSA